MQASNKIKDILRIRFFRAFFAADQFMGEGLRGGVSIVYWKKPNLNRYLSASAFKQFVEKYEFALSFS